MVIQWFVTKTVNPKTAAPPARGTPSRGASRVLVPGRLIAHEIGGHLALDFCNTAGEHLAAQPIEMLPDWESFLRWATQVGLIGPRSYFELIRHPEPLDEIILLREAVYRTGLAVAGVRETSKRELHAICEAASAPRPEISFDNNRAHWCPAPSHASRQICGLLAGEALSLFCSPRSARIGICEGGNCGWLFLDESRGKRRRWCDMNDCGSRAKARRYYEKHKGP